MRVLKNVGENDSNTLIDKYLDGFLCLQTTNTTNWSEFKHYLIIN